jgi:hypothetical protein
MSIASAMADIGPIIIGLARLYWIGGGAKTDDFFQVFDLGVAPTSTVTVPLLSFVAMKTDPVNINFGPIGANFANGIVCAWSTTLQVYTKPAVATNYTTHFMFAQ